MYIDVLMLGWSRNTVWGGATEQEAWTERVLGGCGEEHCGQGNPGADLWEGKKLRFFGVWYWEGSWGVTAGGRGQSTAGTLS